MADPACAAVVHPIARRAAVPVNAVPAMANDEPSTAASETAPAALARSRSRKAGANPKTRRHTAAATSPIRISRR